jgi:AraC-like DNA-binding protein
VVYSVALMNVISARMQICEIAERVGFGDYKNFYANFKKYLGVPPRVKSSPR